MRNPFAEGAFLNPTPTLDGVGGEAYVGRPARFARPAGKRLRAPKPQACVESFRFCLLSPSGMLQFQEGKLRRCPPGQPRGFCAEANEAKMGALHCPPPTARGSRAGSSGPRRARRAPLANRGGASGLRRRGPALRRNVAINQAERRRGGECISRFSRRCRRIAFSRGGGSHHSGQSPKSAPSSSKIRPHMNLVH